MVLFADASIYSTLLNIVVIFLSLVLMFVVLVQRGKGGGLAGAFGGVGGSSPFGSRAGDAFTKFTLYLAGIWVLVIMIHVKVAKADKPDADAAPTVITAPGGK